MNSSIEWTHHTFNPWWGCAKVSPACANCYAEAWAKRVGQNVWGKNGARRFFSEKHWSEPISWNEKAVQTGERSRVFCASMSDVFEKRPDLEQYRRKLWELIEKTKMLDWLLLTKRPQNIFKMAPWNDRRWPTNVWIGTTVENQKQATIRLPFLLEVPAAVRFLSCEPLLGNIDLSSLIKKHTHPIDWVIAGGESGHGARPMNPVWVRSLRDFCKSKKIAFHFKQWGHWAPVYGEQEQSGRIIELDGHVMAAVGKLHAGRMLDGATWDGLPHQKAA
ncbi:MAG: phage Gp37/Gp68 family protein [Terrimicrobiaceae bacterium]|nr:phage Gp37/Gp68 family protein [Terrimicrobiaceae bacterium]